LKLAREIVAIWVIDATIHRRFILLCIPAFALALPLGNTIGVISSESASEIPFIFSCILAPMVFAWYFVGFERTWGTEYLLRSLPERFSIIALAKLSEIILWSLLTLLASAGAHRLFKFNDVSAELTVRLFALPSIVILSCVATAVYLLVPQKLAMYAILAVVAIFGYLLQAVNFLSLPVAWQIAWLSVLGAGALVALFSSVVLTRNRI
jgi:uncharacterized membrane protein